MSLISEALKKARQEAARQDALRPGVPYAVGAVEPPQRRNPLLPLLAGLGAGCLLAGLLFGGAWIAGVGPFDQPSRDRETQVQVAQAPAVPVEPTAAPQAATPAPAPVVTEIASPAPTPPPVAATPVPEERPQPVEAPPAPPVEQPVIRLEPHVAPAPAPAPVEEERPPVLVAEPSPVPPTLQAQPVPPRPVVPAPAIPGGLEEGKVYTGEVPVPGGGSLKLNGIAFSQDQPIVVLDGRVMGPGEVIQGFTVVEIQSDRVKLQGHGTTVFVTTK